MPTCSASAPPVRRSRLSDIPFDKTVAAVRVGRDENGNYVCNPTLPQYETGGMDIVVAGTADAVMMVEGGGNEIDEEDFLGAVEFAHDEIKKIVKAIDQLREKAGKNEARVSGLRKSTPTLDKWVRKTFAKDVAKAMRIVDKQERERGLRRDLRVDEAIARCGKKDDDVRALLEDPATHKEFDKIIKAMEEDELRTMVVDEKIRPDGRKPDEIRPIWCKVHYVPRVHGSGVFTRGQTQVFTAATLGSTSDAQRLDGIVALEDKRYMHFYNFPPYSVGETRPMRGPGRREIGHGHLAERALVPVLPAKDEFPYTLRLMSEMLESNGSSSMASVCGSTLALMDAGVPIREARRRRRDGPDPQRRQVHASSPTFRASKTRSARWTSKSRAPRRASPRSRWTSRSQGITIEIMREAMDAGAASRATSSSTSSPRRSPQPREELSKYAPRMIVMKINPAKIKDVIGPGGKVINKIIADTGVEKIDIEDDGSVFITSPDGASGDKAKQIVENLTKEIARRRNLPRHRHAHHQLSARSCRSFPAKKASSTSASSRRTRSSKVEDVVKIGDEIMVKVMEIDGQGRINLSRKALLGGVSPQRRLRRARPARSAR